MTRINGIQKDFLNASFEEAKNKDFLLTGFKRFLR